MCVKCNEKNAYLEKAREGVIEIASLGKGIITHYEAIAMLVGIAAGIGITHGVTKAEMLELTSEIMNDTDSLAKRIQKNATLQ